MADKDVTESEVTRDEQRLLAALARGVSFVEAVESLGLGVSALAVAFGCIAKGWVHSGAVTEAGRKIALGAATMKEVALETMLMSQLAGLEPLGRARKLESIALALAEKFRNAGKKPSELMWLERAKEARNAADKLAREMPRVEITGKGVVKS